MLSLAGAGSEKGQKEGGDKLATLNERHRDEYTSSDSVESGCKLWVGRTTALESAARDVGHRARTMVHLNAASSNGRLRMKKAKIKSTC